MLIDWVTAYVPRERISDHVWSHLEGLSDRITRYCPATGEVKYETAAWDSVRSDSHQLSIQCTQNALRFCGSPARVCGDSDTVFGSGASQALDLVGCVSRMSQFVAHVAGLPSLDLLPHQFQVTRVDVTGNLLLGDLAEVRTALGILRNCEGGRYRVSQLAGDTVYWGGKSRIKRGKAYAKGPHLRYLMKQRDYTGRQYTQAEIALADRLLRLELTLGRKFFDENGPWHEMSQGFLYEQWQGYFDRMVGDAEVKTESDLKRKLFENSPTDGQARAAYGLFLLIKSEGWDKAREATSDRTWYRNLRLLREAGLGDADISTGQIVQFRRKVLDYQLVENWDDLRAAA